MKVLHAAAGIPPRRGRVAPAVAHEIEIRLTMNVLARDEEEAARVVSTDAVERLTAVLDELYAENPRFAGYRLLTDELVD